jgi:dihydroorotate dehydrogenase
MDDVIRYFVAGASAVQVGTSLFARPDLAGDFVAELERWMEREGVDGVADLRSTRLPDRSSITNAG